MTASVLRTFAHETVTTMAQHASIPVINALSDLEHPCQAMADMLTLQEHFGDLRNVHLAYVGDGNNVAHSLMLAAASLGASISIATPEGYEPNADITDAAAGPRCRSQVAASKWFNDPLEAVAGADAVYTDVWASMGQEVEAERPPQDFRAVSGQPEAVLVCRQACRVHALPAGASR